jgi:FMN phosphatase YigB (HAD superfamily)
MIRAILFDFERTLVDVTSRPAAAALFREGAGRCHAFLSDHDVSLPAAEKFHRKQKWIFRRYEWLRRLSGGEPDMRRLLRRMCRDYGLQRDHGSLATLAWQWYEPRAALMRLPDDVIPTLSLLAEYEIELGVVVNTPWQGQVIDQHLESLGLLAYFPARAYSTEIGARKPDARLFEVALHAMRVNAAETMFVSTDGKTDLLTAQRLGMMTVLRCDPKPNRPISWADQVIQNLGDLLTLPQLSHVRPRPRPIATPIPQLIV